MVWLLQNSTENTWHWVGFKHMHVSTATTVHMEVFHKVTVPSAILWDSGIYSWPKHKSSHCCFTFDILAAQKRKNLWLTLVPDKELTWAPPLQLFLPRGLNFAENPFLPPCLQNQYAVVSYFIKCSSCSVHSSSLRTTFRYTCCLQCC